VNLAEAAAAVDRGQDGGAGGIDAGAHGQAVERDRKAATPGQAAAELGARVLAQHRHRIGPVGAGDRRARPARRHGIEDVALHRPAQGFGEAGAGDPVEPFEPGEDLGIVEIALGLVERGLDQAGDGEARPGDQGGDLGDREGAVAAVQQKIIEAGVPGLEVIGDEGVALEPVGLRQAGEEAAGEVEPGAIGKIVGERPQHRLHRVDPGPPERPIDHQPQAALGRQDLD